jgi:predicted transcriptional regulator
MSEQKTMQACVKLPEDLYRRAQDYARATDDYLARVIRVALRQYLEKQEVKAK